MTLRDWLWFGEEKKENAVARPFVEYVHVFVDNFSFQMWNCLGRWRGEVDVAFVVTSLSVCLWLSGIKRVIYVKLGRKKSIVNNKTMILL